MAPEGKPGGEIKRIGFALVCIINVPRAQFQIIDGLIKATQLKFSTLKWCFRWIARTSQWLATPEWKLLPLMQRAWLPWCRTIYLWLPAQHPLEKTNCDHWLGYSLFLLLASSANTFSEFLCLCYYESKKKMGCLTYYRQSRDIDDAKSAVNWDVFLQGKEVCSFGCGQETNIM